MVAQSWERCRGFGLDPLGRPDDAVLSVEDLKCRREVSSSLRRLAMAEMQLLYSQIAGSNFMIALADGEGVVLDTISDQHFAESASGRSIVPGSAWNEEWRGTNALGIAVRERQPSAIYGREHYFSCHGHLSCMAAPIFDSSGRVLGLLDASCSHEARQQHTHALVRMAAAQIENGLIYQERAGTFIFAFHPRVEYLDTLSAGLVAVSREGEVCSLNRPGTVLLAGLPAQVGSRFDDLFEAGFGGAMDGMMQGGVIRIRDRAGSGVFMVCRQIGARPALAAPPTHRLPALVGETARPDFVCDDPVIRHQLGELPEALALRMPVHISGETGTGKELMARHVHKASLRKGEFVAVNCGALADSLFIAELFGYVPGAFTDARGGGSPGLARSADEGTLFLDEVADIPPAGQTALLRFLDTMEVRPVGGHKSEKIDVQIVSATNADLQEMVAHRTFRADLLYRLNAYTVTLPRLAARSDLAVIAHALMEKMAPGTVITDTAIARLATMPWPGNIRELRSVLQRALVRRQNGFIDEDSLGPERAIEDDCCPNCRDHPLSRRKCSEIRAIFRNTGENVSETARLLSISRTTVYKHVGRELGRADHLGRSKDL
ncbi:MAG: sigma-54-dependent Fis family transcriptional regulator [Hyphomicrobiales bacterium]|nr:sigma-54-dependent Fis family transcriptional regulator [Hyphomicrobiales bacterium]